LFVKLFEKDILTRRQNKKMPRTPLKIENFPKQKTIDKTKKILEASWCHLSLEEPLCASQYTPLSRPLMTLPRNAIKN